LYLHGLAVQAAEALAEWIHRRIRKEWGLKPDQGLRFSPGFPAWPRLEDQKRIWELLQPQEVLGVTLTEAWQMVPEATVSAMVMHHPGCVYFTSPLPPRE
jgi:5-methyltetrahydrofolate--homocysteine methyltransferase